MIPGGNAVIVGMLVILALSVILIAASKTWGVLGELKVVAGWYIVSVQYYCCRCKSRQVRELRSTDNYTEVPLRAECGRCGKFQWLLYTREDLDRAEEARMNRQKELRAA